MCAGTKGPEMDIYICLFVLLQETNHVKRVIKSLIVGTTSLYIGRARNCATNCPRMPSYWQLLSEKRIERPCIMAYLGFFDCLVCYVVLINVQVLSKCPSRFSVVAVG